MFNVIEKEMKWRRDQGLPEGFDTMRKFKPIVAVGASEPLGGQTMMADYYRSFVFCRKAKAFLLMDSRWYRWFR